MDVLTRLAALALLLLAGRASAAEPIQPAAAWTELTGHGAEVRAIAREDHCPIADIDGHAIPLGLRAPANAEFPGVCSLAVPRTARSVKLNGRAMPMPAAEARRIVVIGDSGCRVKGTLVQDCNDPSKWPFPRIAALAAAKAPDLVIHVGDYYYRESPCPLGKTVCPGSPHGDRFSTWKADFLDPSAPLMAAAPMILVRGNHESCKRGGQ